MTTHALQGKNAIVTGSTSGIGQAIAEALAGAGANVMLNGFGDENDIEAQRKDLADKNNVNILYHGADMTQPDQIEDLVKEAEGTLGSIDILVNNAGIQHVSPIDEFPVDKWNAIIAINLSAAFHMIRLCTPSMKQSGWGRIINIASSHALVASPFKSAYVAAKHGIAGMTKVVALELAQKNITCNAICPGYVKTPLVENQIGDTAKARGISEEEVIRDVLLAAQPTKKFTEISQLGALSLFLCSDAAANMTGSLLPVDGGWTAQ